MKTITKAKKEKIRKELFVDYKDVHALSRYISEHGKIIPRRMSGVNQVKQAEIAKAVKRARSIGLIGYTKRF